MSPNTLKGEDSDDHPAGFGLNPGSDEERIETPPTDDDEKGPRSSSKHRNRPSPVDSSLAHKFRPVPPPQEGAQDGKHVTIVSPKSDCIVSPYTPYSEVYGQHPSTFDFDRKGRKVCTREVIKAMAYESVAAAEALAAQERATKRMSVRAMLQSDAEDIEGEDDGPMPLSPLLATTN
eukprot:TRINITY_DN19645_c0_g1_i1.p1 TRINITY_DN19645_c0_g1~~TRINITY_DN19645_c0_g1_i1.p1  ORF type:complete len:177 (+),score=32.56 TRINITY_DN19645_c0_g1_i1:82-612(+)